jgi:stage IV sporulation protein FB
MTFRIFNINTRVDFFLIFILFAGIIGGQVQEVIAIILSITVHEAAHIIIADSLGLKIDEIEFMPFGGKIKIGLIEEARLESRLLTTLAGPMANFLTSLLLFIAVKGDIIPIRIGFMLIDYQLKFGFLNLLPALPLDGGRIFALWLMQHMSFIESIRIASRMGKIIGLVLIFAGIGGFILKKGLFLFLIMGVFLFLQSSREEREAPLTFMKLVSGKKGIFLKKGFLPVEQIVVLQDVEVKKILYLFMPQKYYIVCVVDKKMRVIKCLTETEIFDKIICKGLDIRMEDLI